MKKISLVFLLCFSVAYSQNSDSLRSESFYQEALRFSSERMYDSVFLYLDKCISSSEKGKYYPVYYNALLFKGNMFISYGKLAEAGELYKRLQKEAEQNLGKDEPLLLTIYSSHVVYHAYNRDKVSRDFFINKTKRWVEEHGVPKEKVLEYLRFLDNISKMVLDDGDYYESIEHAQQALDIIQTAPGEKSQYDETSILINETIGSANIALEKYLEALKAFERGISIAEANKTVNPEIIWRLKRRISYAYLKVEEVDKAIELCREVLNRKAKYLYPQQKEYDQSVLNHILGHSYTEKGEYTLAREYLSKAIKQRKAFYLNYQKFTRHREIGNSLYRLAELQIKEGKKEAALKSLQKSLPHFSYSFSDTLSSANPELDDLIYTYFYLKDILKRKGDLQAEIARKKQDIPGMNSALKTYQLLLDLIHRDRKRFKAEQTKFFILEKAKPSFEAAIKLALDLYEKTEKEEYAELAYRFSEESKAVLLFASLQASQLKNSLFLPDSLREKEENLKRELVDYQEQIYKLSSKTNAQDSVIANYRKEAFRIKEELKKLESYLAEHYPDYFELKNSPQHLSIAEIQKKLKDKESRLLEYFVGQENIFSFEIGPNYFYHKTIPYSSKLNQALVGLIQSLHGNQAYNRSDFAENSQYIFQQIFSSQANQDNAIKSLIIIADDLLGYLPFEALSSANHSEGQTSYLLANNYISYAYSANILFSQKTSTTNRAKEKWIGYAPAYTADKFLAFNQEEVTTINTLYEGRSRLAELATKSDFFQFAPDHNIIHLAMHGYVNDDDPLYSYLDFYSKQEESDSSKLFAHEIFLMDLDAELVVLSACKTGFGPLAKGEGIMSLARSFVSSGCPSIAMSLWESDGSVSKLLMEKFYRNLEDGLAKDEALQKAKLSYLQEAPPNRKAPQYWANFVLIGEASPIKTSRIWWYILGGFLSILIFYATAQFSKKSKKFD